MPIRAKYTNAEHTQGWFIRLNGVTVHGALPPDSGDIKVEFDAFMARGGTVEDYDPAAAEPDPVSSPPRIVAIAMGIEIADGDVFAIRGSFNVTAALYLGVGMIMLVYLNPVPPLSFVFGSVGAAIVTPIEREPSYCILEISDAGGNLFDPPRLDVAVIAL